MIFACGIEGNRSDIEVKWGRRRIRSGIEVNRSDISETGLESKWDRSQLDVLVYVDGIDSICRQMPNLNLHAYGLASLDGF